MGPREEAIRATAGRRDEAPGDVHVTLTIGMERYDIGEMPQLLENDPEAFGEIIGAITASLTAAADGLRQRSADVERMLLVGGEALLEIPFATLADQLHADGRLVGVVRAASGVSRRALAAGMGISRDTLRKWEQGADTRHCWLYGPRAAERALGYLPGTTARVRDLLQARAEAAA